MNTGESDNTKSVSDISVCYKKSKYAQRCKLAQETYCVRRCKLPLEICLCTLVQLSFKKICRLQEKIFMRSGVSYNKTMLIDIGVSYNKNLI